MTPNNLATIFWILSFIVSFYSYFSYYKSMLHGDTKPHVFSWLIWWLVSLGVFAIQVYDHAGIGSLNILFVAVLCLGIAWLAMKKWERTMTSSDKMCLWAGLLSIVVWLFTKNPTYSVIVLILIDIFGFIPTYIKSYHVPYEEDIAAYFFAFLGYALSLWALSHLSFLTAWFVGATALLNISLVCIIALRRMFLEKDTA